MFKLLGYFTKMNFTFHSSINIQQFHKYSTVLIRVSNYLMAHGLAFLNYANNIDITDGLKKNRGRRRVITDHSIPCYSFTLIPCEIINQIEKVYCPCSLVVHRIELQMQ